MGVLKISAAAAALASCLLVGPTSATTDRNAFTGYWMSDKGDGATEIKPCGEGLCGYIYSINQVFDDPQIRHLGIAQSVTKQDGKPLPVVGQPVQLSRTPSRIVAPPPEMGEHTDEVLAEFGCTAEEIDELRRAGAV